MSSSNTVDQTSNSMITDYSTLKIFIWNNRSILANFTNDTYDPITLQAGTLMGRIASTGEVVPLTSGASDGSQLPLGILMNNITVEDGDTVELTLCVSGDVNENGVIFQGSDDFDTVVSGKTLRDRIGSDTVGIKLVPSTELTKNDNPNNP
jgi:hypothetical protein